MEKQELSKKSYTVEIVTYDNGVAEIRRTVEGFNALELLGILQHTTSDIIEQIKGQSEFPKIVKKTRII